MLLKTEYINNGLTLKLTHRGDELIYSISLNNRVSRDSIDFEELNQWYHYLEMNNRTQEVDEVFAIFKDLYEYLSDTITDIGVRKISDAATYVRNAISKLYKYHNVNEVVKMFELGGQLDYPPNVNETYIDNQDGTNTREQTYTKKDYRYLAAYVVTLRALIPIINHFTTKFYSGNKMGASSKLRYLSLYDLIMYTGYLDNPSFNKLREYILHTANGKEISIDNIYDGATSEKREEWLMSNVIFKIFVAPIKLNNNKSNLITMIYHTTGQLLDDNRFSSSRIRNKNDTKGDDLNDKLSMLEKYKIRHDISPGDFVEIDAANSNLEYITTTLVDGPVDMALLNLLHENNQDIGLREINQTVVSLISWCVKKICPPKGLLYLRKETIIKVMTATQYMLFHKGHMLAGLLASSYVVQDESEAMYSFETINPGSTTGKYDKEILSELIQLYPYAKPNKRNRDQIPKETDYIVINDISYIASDFYMKRFFTPLKPATLNKLGIRHLVSGEQIIVEQDIKNILGSLIINLNKEANNV